MRPGRFITIEGGEGVGKSLLEDKVAQILQKALGSRRLVVTREPGGTPAANQIRHLFGAPPANDPFLMETEAFLVSAARAQHVGRLIAPTLSLGDWILCDRFADSTRVYQGRIGGLPGSMVETLISLSTKDLQPDLTFLLDCDVEVALKRLASRTISEGDAIKRYDDAAREFHTQVRDGFLELLGRFPKRFVALDATRSQAAVLEQALAILKDRFGPELEPF